MNETDVREVIVRPLLGRLGYDHGTEATIRTEITLRYDRSFLGHKQTKKDPPLIGRADYICDVISFGRWVVEVKSPSEDLSQKVVEQAHTYAMHPEIAASFFLIANGRKFRLYETAKFERAALEWNFEDEDDNLLRLFNVLSPAAFRKRARARLVDPGMPLGKGLASRLRIIGGKVTYEEHNVSHPFLQASVVNGLSLPVTGGYVMRADDKRIVGHLQMAKSAPLMRERNVAVGHSDDYDFFLATEYLSDNPEFPSIFQNLVTADVPVGKEFSLPGMPRLSMPFSMSFRAFTEAVGFVQDDKFVGTMRLVYNFSFSDVSSQVQKALAGRLGQFPTTARMVGTGRFEISIQADI